MSGKPKAKRVVQAPKRPGSIPLSAVSKAVKKVAAARRRQRQQEPVADGAR
jgi:hypothetical protein